MSDSKRGQKSPADEMFEAVGEVSKRMAEWDEDQDAKRKRRMTKVTEFVGVANGEDGGHFFWFDTMTREERDAMWLRARGTSEWPEDDGYVYGSELLPKVEPGQRGRWRVTVEFEPEEQR